jgi:tripartite-type tricarboxylate transporter receptor subunit TctC
MHHRLMRAAAAFGLFVASAFALAQYPSKPVSIVVPFPVGSVSDLAARILANEMGAAMGQPVVVQNRPGANSAIGAAAVATAPPDGYTLLLATAGTVALPALVKSLPYDTQKDLIPVSDMARFVQFLYVNAEVPVKSVPELAAYARAHPGKLAFATGNPVGIVATSQFLALAGKLDMLQVPYKGEPAAVIDLASNRVQVMFATPSSADSFIKGGKLRVLATSIPRRAPSAPDVPSMNEYYPGFSATAWAGVMAPRGVPKEIVDRLSREVTAALDKPDTQEKLGRLQVVAQGSTPEAFERFFREQLELYPRLLRAAGVEPQ